MINSIIYESLGKSVFSFAVTCGTPNVNRSELGSVDNVIPAEGRCSSNGTEKKKYAARGVMQTRERN